MQAVDKRENWVMGIRELSVLTFYIKPLKKKTSGKLLNLEQQHNSTSHVRAESDVFPMVSAFIPHSEK